MLASKRTKLIRWSAVRRYAEGAAQLQCERCPMAGAKSRTEAEIVLVKDAGLGGGVGVRPAMSQALLDPTAQAVERARQLNQINASMLAQSTPGGSLQFTSASDFGVGLRRTYARPIAVGTRSLVLEIERRGADFVLVGAQPNDSAQPTFLNK